MWHFNNCIFKCLYMQSLKFLILLILGIFETKIFRVTAAGTKWIKCEKIEESCFHRQITPLFHPTLNYVYIFMRSSVHHLVSIVSIC